MEFTKYVCFPSRVIFYLGGIAESQSRMPTNLTHTYKLAAEILPSQLCSKPTPQTPCQTGIFSIFNVCQSDESTMVPHFI